MAREQVKQNMKLRLLALVLALSMIWYSLNPVPAPIICRKGDEELPDEQKRNLEPQRLPVILPVAFGPIRKLTEIVSTLDEDEDDFEWPEFIDG